MTTETKFHLFTTEHSQFSSFQGTIGVQYIFVKQIKFVSWFNVSELPGTFEKTTLPCDYVAM